MMMLILVRREEAAQTEMLSPSNHNWQSWLCFYCLFSLAHFFAHTSSASFLSFVNPLWMIRYQCNNKARQKHHYWYWYSMNEFWTMICHVKIEIYRCTSIRQKYEVKRCVFILKSLSDFHLCISSASIFFYFSAGIEGLFPFFKYSSFLFLVKENWHKKEQNYPKKRRSVSSGRQHKVSLLASKIKIHCILSRLRVCAYW